MDSSATAAPPSERSSFHIPSLDGLRAVAVLVVFVSHAGIDAVPGGFGVTVFFFLSGYLITTLLRRELATTSGIDFRAFYLRRALRIFPPLYVCLGLALVFGAIGFTAPGFGSRAGVLAQAFHVTNYWSLIDPDGVFAFPAGTVVYWSLAIEEHFYLLFPVVALVLMRRFEPRQQAQILLSVCGAVLIWRMILVVGLDATENRTYVGTDTRIDAILYGCIMGLYRNPAVDPVVRTTQRTRLGLLAVSVVVILASMAYREPVYRETFRYTVQSVALAPIFYFAITNPTEMPYRLLNLRPVQFLGVVSYTFYLNHLVFIGGFRYSFPGLAVPVLAAVSFAAILATSVAIHHGIEQPLLTLRRRLRKTPVG